MKIRWIKRVIFTAAVLSACAFTGLAKRSIEYKIIVKAADLSGFDVEIRILNPGKRPLLAMAAHPEYDDRYFRYIKNFSAESDGRSLSVSKPEENLWQIDGAGRTMTVRYRVSPDAKEREWRQSWKPFLMPTGGLVGDLHSVMYIVGEESRRARVTLDLPAGWTAVSGLEPTRDPRAFTGSAEDILDSPILIGNLIERRFEKGGVPHTVAIFSPPGSRPLDTKVVFDGIERLAGEAIRAFGKPPYPRYAFLLENGGQAGLEHKTSLNVGIAGELKDSFDNIAHEYIHVWNLMDVRPRERIGVRYKFANPTGVLWWSEGATIMFSDLLLRRAKLPREDLTRIAYLESILTRYYSSPGYWQLSAEVVSRADSHPEFLGEYFASTHLQGEVLVTMLDYLIRDRTDNRRNATDVMRLLARRFDSKRGIDNTDLERAIAEVCRCDIKPFFNEYIRNAKEVDHDGYLSLVGLRAEVRQVPALDDQGRPLVDRRIGPATDTEFTIRVLNSESTWSRSGLRTGDRVTSADGRPIKTWSDFRSWLAGLKIGDTAKLTIIRDGRVQTITVPITGFDRPQVRVTEVTGAGTKAARLRNAWLNAQ